jgi:uncharacterized repeat protein (TIGR01451 family)
MADNMHGNLFRIASLAFAILVVVFAPHASASAADDGLDRLLQKAQLQAPDNRVPEKSNVACIIPSSMHDAKSVSPAGHAQELQFTDPTGFSARGELSTADCEILPAPICGPGNLHDSARQDNPWNPNSQRDEYVFDGDDRNKKVQVDRDWKIYGLDTEDTVGHFDTLDGRRLVTPSNRVAIYAPRFGAVRKLNGLFNAQSNVPVGAMEEKTIIARAAASNLAKTTKQHLAVERFDGGKRASGLRNRTRGVVADNVTHLFGIRNTFEPYENLSLIRIGKFSKAEGARLNLGIQSAQVWEDDLGLQVAVQNAQPIIVNDVAVAQELFTIESDDDTAILRVTKIASKIAAETGEHVDFTIRFDNLSGRKIGNVTIIDNLTRRLEYVPDSAECSLKADFIPAENEGGSLMLRWEIIDPMPANSGGVIRFRCRVR